MSEVDKIIIAEDNIADLELIKIAIKETGRDFEILHAIDGKDLIKLVKEMDLGEIKLILLDLNMPKMGGIEVLKYFYSDDVLRMLPIVVFTSSFHQNDVITCYEHGANAYVCKPIDMSEYYKAIHAIINFWTTANVIPSYKPLINVRS